MCVHYGEKGLFLSVYVDDIKLAGTKQNIDPMWEVLMEEVDLGEPTSFLDHVYLGCIQREFKQAEILWTMKEICLNPKSVLEPTKRYFIQRIVAQTFLHGLMWKVMQTHVLSDIANWRTEQVNSYIKSQLHALMTIISKKKNRNLLENCQKFSLKLFFLMFVFGTHW